LLQKTSEQASHQDGNDWQEEPQLSQTNNGELSARVSPDGVYFAFTSLNEVTHFDNEDATTKKPDKEIFLYDAAGNRVVCVSCGAADVHPVGNTELPLPTQFTLKAYGQPVYLSRNVLDDGRVFFTSPNVLVAQQGKTGGVDNVFEYEEGRARLISSGVSPDPSVFYDASADGRDVFFVTAQSLVGADRDNGDSIYDAREGGGFPPGPGEGVQSPACEPEDCRAPAGEAPVGQSAASSVFSGPGNLLAPPPVVVGKSQPRVLTRAQKLANALRVCRRDRSKKKRGACEARARKQYGANAKKKGKTLSGKVGVGR